MMILIQKTALIIALCVIANLGYAQQYDTLKIAPPPGGGMYIGQYEWLVGDIDTFEMTIGRPTAWFGRLGAIDPNASGFPVFDSANAEAAWQNGKITIVNAIEAYPNPADNSVVGFTVDKLLAGDYDTALVRLAAEFASFGKPMFFHTAREPLGIAADYMGGFGANGDKSFFWAIQNSVGLKEFDPSVFPNAWLYADLGDSLVSDGVERLVAAQRYYKHFFNNHGCKFLTFETMGFNMLDPVHIENEIQDAIVDFPSGDSSNIRQLYESSFNFENYYPGDDYTDWVSINFYTLDFYAANWTGLTQDYFIATKKYLDDLDYTMNIINSVAPNKPVLFLELGFPDGYNKSSQRAADKVDSVFTHLINNQPNIQGFSMWSNHPSWQVPDVFPYDCLVRPNTLQGDKLKSIMDNNANYFKSCTYFTDGSIHPFCPVATSTSDIEKEKKSLTIYPNPFSDYTTIEFKYEHNNNYKLSIYDAIGRQVDEQKNITSGQIRIEKKELISGVYFLTLTNNNLLIATEKLMVK